MTGQLTVLKSKSSAITSTCLTWGSVSRSIYGQIDIFLQAGDKEKDKYTEGLVDIYQLENLYSHNYVAFIYVLLPSKA